MLRMVAQKHTLLALTAAWLLVAQSSAQAQTLLRWKFKPGETLRYVSTEEVTEKGQLAGKTPVTFRLSFGKDDVWKITSVDTNGVATIDSSIDRLQLKAQGPQGVLVEFDTASEKEPTGMAKLFAQVAGAMVKKVTVVRINPRGEVLEAKPPQGLLESLKKLLPGVPSFDDFFNAEGMKKMQVNVEFPEKPVTKGQTWTQKEDFQLPAPFGGTLGIANKYEYLGPERRGAVELQKIAITVLMATVEEQPAQVKPSDGQPGQKQPVAPLLKFKNSECRGTIYFDNAHGRMVECTMQIKAHMEINVMGKQGTADMEGSVRIKLQAADGAPEKPKS